MMTVHYLQGNLIPVHKSVMRGSVYLHKVFFVRKFFSWLMFLFIQIGSTNTWRQNASRRQCN